MNTIEGSSMAESIKEAAFELAFSQYWKPLFKSALKKVGSADVAKDLVQEVFIVYWHNMPEIKEEGKLLAYLYTVLRHKTLQLFEKDEVRLRYAERCAKLSPVLTYSSEALLLSKELSQIITDEVEKMPNKMREIYLLKREQHLSIYEISQYLCLSQQTVKNQLQNATHRLKSRLREYDTSLVPLAIIFLASL